MKDNYTLCLSHRIIPGDLITPVSAFLRLRSVFVKPLLLESSNFMGKDNSMSFICCNPIADFIADGTTVSQRYPCGDRSESEVENSSPDVLRQFKDFQSKFTFSDYADCAAAGPVFFGYSSYRAVEYFEDISLRPKEDPEFDIPDLMYSVYEYLIAFDHFRDQVYLMQWKVEGQDKTSPYNSQKISTLDDLQKLITFRSIAPSTFSCVGEEKFHLSDDAYGKMVTACKLHIKRGDVFQIVPSRRFSQHYKGDDFQVYRALRSINPSPYLFYFDFGEFRLFGSSPEAQIVIKDNKASIAPIAGTLPRSSGTDEEIAARLRDDPKESAEHVMLVDLARNDLSRHCSQVEVVAFKEVHFYSHVTHLVSVVTGKLNEAISTLDIFADTFPAGTLTGAPKYRAMELIDQYEPSGRTFYGGAIGYFSIDGSINHAIIIRSFLSKGGVLFSQAGAGVVNDSQEHLEIKETHNKLGALKEALRRAGDI